MRIITYDNDININPFIFVNIYEKQKKEDNSFNKYYNLTLLNNEIISGKLNLYFEYPIDNPSTNYILVQLIPNINLELVQINYEITNSDYTLNNGESKNITKILPNLPYYYCINSKQYQQVNISLTMNYINAEPFESIEIYEFSEKYGYNSHNKYINKKAKFINDDNKNILTSSFSYMIDSIYTNYALIKITPKFGLEYLNTKINIGGGNFDIDKGLIKNISNLISKYSYYLFTLSSKGEKLNFKLIINSNKIKDPFDSLNIIEYKNRHLPSTFIQNTNEEFQIERKDNKLIAYISYQTKNISTNFVSLKIIPNYNLSSIECLIETEIEEDNPSSFSIVGVLTIILIVIILITVIIFIIYIKKICLKSSSNDIEDLYKNKNKTEKKFELALLPFDPNSSLN